jgi:hypothetical protein
MTILAALIVSLVGGPQAIRPAPAGYPTTMPATVYTAPIGHLEGVTR